MQHSSLSREVKIKKIILTKGTNICHDMLDIVYIGLRVIFVINKGKALVIALWK